MPGSRLERCLPYGVIPLIAEAVLPIGILQVIIA
jgi:hypothetical protein